MRACKCASKAARSRQHTSSPVGGLAGCLSAINAPDRHEATGEARTPVSRAARATRLSHCRCGACAGRNTQIKLAGVQGRRQRAVQAALQRPEGGGARAAAPSPRGSICCSLRMACNSPGLPGLPSKIQTNGCVYCRLHVCVPETLYADIEPAPVSAPLVVRTGQQQTDPLNEESHFTAGLRSGCSPDLHCPCAQPLFPPWPGVVLGRAGPLHPASWAHFVAVVVPAHLQQVQHVT